MYESHFGLDYRPFSLLPDAEGILWTDRHRLAFSVLQLGVDRLSPVTVLTGGIGTGKTTLIRHMLHALPEFCTIGLLSNFAGERGDLLRWVLLAFGQDFSGSSDAVLYRRLERFLAGEHGAGRRSVLIVDEAQNLSDGELENLRLLSNINAQDVLLMLVLVGQPQLRARLMQPENRRIRQRVCADFHLDGLTREESESYVRHRVGLAGGPPDLFDGAALDEIHRITDGIPRKINVLCDLCLISGFAEGVGRVEAALVRSVVEEARRHGVFASLTGSPMPEAALGDTAQPETRGAPVEERLSRLAVARAAQVAPGGAARRDEASVLGAEEAPDEMPEAPGHPVSGDGVDGHASDPVRSAEAFAAEHDRIGGSSPVATAPLWSDRTWWPPVRITDRAVSGSLIAGVVLVGVVAWSTLGSLAPASWWQAAGPSPDEPVQEAAAPGVAAVEGADSITVAQGRESDSPAIALNSALTRSPGAPDGNGAAGEPTAALAASGRPSVAGTALAPRIDGESALAEGLVEFHGRAADGSAEPEPMPLVGQTAAATPRTATASPGPPLPARRPTAALGALDRPGESSRAVLASGEGMPLTVALQLLERHRPVTERAVASDDAADAGGGGAEPATAGNGDGRPVRVAGDDAELLFRRALDLAADDATAAVVAYARAAAAGHQRAAYYLAQIYETGDGVPADLALAREWYERAADGSDGARRRLADLPEPDRAGRLPSPLALAAVPVGRGHADFVWTSGAGVDPGFYIVEIAADPAEGAIASHHLPVSAAQLPLPAGANHWRVLAVDPAGARYAASDWSIIAQAASGDAWPSGPEDAPGEAYPSVTIAYADPGATAGAEELRQSLGRLGIPAQLAEAGGVELTGDGVHYFYAQDAEAAAAVAALLPGEAIASLVAAEPAGGAAPLPGELLATLVSR